MRLWVALLLCVPAALCGERAAYDSTGRIIGLIAGGDELEIGTGLVAVLPTGKRIPIQVLRERNQLRREPGRLAWSGSFELPDQSAGRFQLSAEEDDAGVRYVASVSADSALELESLDFTIDLPRKVFVNGRMKAGGAEIAMPAVKPANPVFYRGETTSLRFDDAAGVWGLGLQFDKPQALSVADRWDFEGRSYQVRVRLVGEVATRFRLTRSETAAAAPARVAIDTAKPRFRFDGFGGNYCWNNDSAATRYTLENLKLAWARFEMKARDWDKQRDNPGPAIRKDLETMRRVQAMGVPYVLSIWWLPERLYTDPYEKPRSGHFRRIDPEKWPEALDLVGSYLLYAKREYGVEPELFSFNEANIGIYVGFSPEDHAGAIKKFGAHFQKLGLKTKMLLGDATGPRDTHNFALAAASDAEAMQFVGAVAFHSWGGGTPDQYAAWGDLAEWLGLPLLVTELGVDAAAYNGRAYDSFDYGLREARMTQELLAYARPQGTHYWQFTNDYALVRTRPDGAVEPTPRFWLMKHFTDLTPAKSESLAASSDSAQVLATAFRANGRYAVHVLNAGPARAVAIEGLPDAPWSITRSTEQKQFEAGQAGRPQAGALRLALPARSLVTLTADTAVQISRDAGR